MKKTIKLGTYCYSEDKNGYSQESCYGCHLSWDRLIKKYGLVGKKLELVLRVAK